ncbi:MAG: hypothetical protein IPJ21_12180 [Sterolibacteriaceae bacterium]|nr:hypothetical protein [Sterolibacteriaceae bacterium]
MIPPDDVLRGVRDALASITAPRFFQTERGYQGALLAQLHQRLLLSDDAIVEQEYQKQAGQHGLTIRPDIIVHEPFDPARHHARTEGNVAVIELKLRATAADALGDFQSLRSMLEVLRYPLGVFVNIDAAVTHAGSIPADLHGRIVCFAVMLVRGVPQIIERRV